MKLKESTFAIIAEKKDSISHKWFNENTGGGYLWDQIGNYYCYNKGSHSCSRNKSELGNIPIYTESEFEALLKAEQENEAKEITQEFKDKFTGGVKGVCMASPEQFTKLTQKENYQVILTYQTAIDLLAYYTKIDKGIIKIEM